MRHSVVALPHSRGLSFMYAVEMSLKWDRSRNVLWRRQPESTVISASKNWWKEKTLTAWQWRIIRMTRRRRFFFRCCVEAACAVWEACGLVMESTFVRCFSCGTETLSVNWDSADSPGVRTVPIRRRTAVAIRYD